MRDNLTNIFRKATRSRMNLEVPLVSKLSLQILARVLLGQAVRTGRTRKVHTHTLRNDTGRHCTDTVTVTSADTCLVGAP